MEPEDGYEAIWKDFPLYQIIACFIEMFVNHHLLTAQFLQFLYIYSACFSFSLLLRSVRLQLMWLAFAEPGALHQGIHKMTRVVILLCDPCLHLGI